MVGRIDPHELETDPQRIFWGLRVASASLKRSFVSSAEISDALATVGRLAISRQKVASTLDAARGAVRRKKIAGKWHYELMRKGEEAIGDGGPGAIMVDPSNGLEAIRRLEDIFGGLTGAVRICDPYVDNKTLDFLAAMVGASEIRLLTHNIMGERIFRRDLTALQRQLDIPIEVRVTAAADNHDRYVVAENEGFLIGTSLNGFAKKRSFVNPITGLRAAILSAFEIDWNRAKKL